MSDSPPDRRSGRRAGAVSLFGTAPNPASPARALPSEDEARRALRDPARTPLFSPARVWKSLTDAQLSVARMIENGLFPQFAPASGAAAAFDLLRTRSLQALAQNGWRRIGVTSPGRGCGKSFIAANLALSLGRRPEGRTVLIDLDLRRPGLAALFGADTRLDICDFLTAGQPLESAFRRHGQGLALGFSGVAHADAAERLQAPDLRASLRAVADHLDPEVILYDLPPALLHDDALSMAGELDAVLLVVDGTRTAPDEVRRFEELFAESLPILGIVLNRSQEIWPGQARRMAG